MRTFIFITISKYPNNVNVTNPLSRSRKQQLTMTVFKYICNNTFTKLNFLVNSICEPGNKLTYFSVYCKNEIRNLHHTSTSKQII